MFIIEIMFVLQDVSKIQVPAVGAAVKNPIALEIPNSPVVFGLISQLPVSILNWRYSAEYPETARFEFTHFPTVESYERICPPTLFWMDVSPSYSKSVAV